MPFLKKDDLPERLRAIVDKLEEDGDGNFEWSNREVEYVFQMLSEAVHEMNNRPCPWQLKNCAGSDQPRPGGSCIACALIELNKLTEEEVGCREDGE